ncbi:hypothetical protein ACOMCU_11305 [Lysinibacillus sp. UGB7]
MQKIIIIGGKGTAINIAEQIDNASKKFGENIELLGFSIDDPSLGKEINGFPVLCSTMDLKKYDRYSDVKYIFALYRPDKMEDRVNLLKSYNISLNKFTNFIHPSSYIARSATIGIGNVILSHSTINSNVKMGNFNIVNNNVVVEHDTNINDYNFIAAGNCIGSNVKLHDGTFIGLNSTIRENLDIENYSFVGMNSNVTRNVNKRQTVYGNPARCKYDSI